MNPFELQQWQYFVLAIFFGTILVIYFYFAHRSDSLVMGRKKDLHDEIHEYPEGITEGRGRVPVFIFVVFAAVFIWALLYTLLIAVYGLKF